jgi:hypothetical protein
MPKQKLRPTPASHALAYTWTGGAEMVELSVATLRRRAKEGLLETVRVGGRTLIKGPSLRRMCGADEQP